MANAKLGPVVRIAFNALRLVGRGRGERSAVRQVVSRNSVLRPFESEAYKLVLHVMSDLDVLDRLIEAAVRESRLQFGNLPFLRLVAAITLARGYSSEVAFVLRRTSPREARPLMEYLLGYIPTMSVESLFDGLGDVDRTALQTHNPPFWVQYCFRVFGRGTALSILANRVRPRYVRVNTLRGKGTKVSEVNLEKFSSGGVQPVEGLNGLFVVRGGLSRLSGYFADGLVQVQDLASFLAVSAAAPVAGESALDVCSSPGGKTAALAQFMGNEGDVLSVDYSFGRMMSWRREVRRLGVRIAEPLVADAARMTLRRAFDLVLVDPPCSGTGILDRHPRMKWRLSGPLIEKYARLQSKILARAASFTRPGGRVVYCTCSLALEENERVVSEFIQDSPEFELEPCLEDFGSPGIGMRESRRFYPHRDSTAGYFVARLKRAS